MDIITHKTKTDWGTYFYFIEKKGIVFGRAYIYDDQPERIFLDSLSVLKKYRGNHYATKMQVIREKFGKKKGCKYAYLYVKRKSWMRKWYKRRGYVFVEVKKDNDQYIWMKKPL